LPSVIEHEEIICSDAKNHKNAQNVKLTEIGDSKNALADCLGDREGKDGEDHGCATKEDRVEVEHQEGEHEEDGEDGPAGVRENYFSERFLPYELGLVPDSEARIVLVLVKLFFDAIPESTLELVQLLTLLINPIKFILISFAVNVNWSCKSNHCSHEFDSQISCRNIFVEQL